MKSPFLFFALALSSVLYAQNYSLQVLTGQTYTDLSSADYEIPHYSPYFGNVNTKPDMYFTAFGKTYDLYQSVYIPLKQGYSYIINDQHSTTIYAAKGDFKQRPGDTSVYSFKTDNTPGNRKFIQQWKNMGFAGGTAADHINFQLWLYEATGVIEVRFGPGSVSNGLWEDGANGPTIGLLEMDADFTIIYNQLWLTGNPSNPGTTTDDVLVNLQSAPAAGTVYRFIPSSSSSSGLKASSKPVTAYPNPCRDEISIKCPGTFTWSIRDISGKELLTGSNTDQTLVNTSFLPGGIYFLHVLSENKIDVKKLLKL